MTLAKCLEETGIRLDHKIGFIIETGDVENGWVPYCAKIGKVQTGIPDGAHDQPELEDYDPEYDLLVLWHAGKEKHLYILRVTDKSSVYGVKQGGIQIIKQDTRIFIGQSDTFMQSVCDAMTALAQ